MPNKIVMNAVRSNQEGNANLRDDDDRDDERRRAPPLAKSAHSVEGTLGKIFARAGGNGKERAPQRVGTNSRVTPSNERYAASGSNASASANAPASRRSPSIA